MPAPPETTTPPPRAVILGASNVTRCAAVVTATAGALRGAPLELLIAAGRGRSYGVWSRVLARSLPPILDCGIWRWLERGPAPSHALVTDVGNDILYGHQPERILEWVQTCVARLRGLGAEVTLARLPMARLERLGPKAYQAARMILVPGHARVPFSEAMRRIAILDEGLAALASTCGATAVTPAGEWYGIDPIHVRRRRRMAAWQTLMASWASTEHEGQRPARASCSTALRLASTLPQYGTFAGFPFGSPDGEPGTVRAGGVVVRLF